MRRRSVSLSLCCLLLIAAMPAVAADKLSLPELEQLVAPFFSSRAAAEAVNLGTQLNACVDLNTSCGSTVNGSLTSGDCATADGNLFDPYVISLTAGTTLTVAANASGSLDPYLILTNQSGAVLATDDDSGPGLNALLTYTVVTSGTYFLGVVSVTSTGFGSYTMTVSCSGSQPPPTTGSCSPNSTTLCLSNNRFRVQVTYRAHDGSTGNGRVVPHSTPDSGLFWFFDENNWEMLIKMINACSFNNHFWVYGAATTDVQYTITVTDTKTGAQKQYNNALGNRAPAITDGTAFATCP